MEAIATQSKQERVSYDILHDSRSCDILFPEKKKKKRSHGKILGIYEAGHVNKEDFKNGGMAFQILFKCRKFNCSWKKFSMEKSTY